MDFKPFVAQDAEQDNTRLAVEWLTANDPEGSTPRRRGVVGRAEAEKLVAELKAQGMKSVRIV